jgi:hypothetical protein
MAKLVWDAVGERFYETGLDRGVLYPQGGVGVPWNGLQSVNISSTGGDSKPTYQDGVNVFNDTNPEVFKGSIKAVTYPDEFAICDGTGSTGNGLAFGLQPRKPFGLSYRTLVNNGVAGPVGYKINLLYNAMAAPSVKDSKTLTATPEPNIFNWALSAKPVIVPNRKPTPHVVIDSRTTDPDILVIIENMLYGGNGMEPRMPTPAQLSLMFGSWPDFGLSVSITFLGVIENFEWIINYVTNPSFELPAGAFIEVNRNLFTNPSFETAGAMAIVRQNLALNPTPVSATTSWLSGKPLQRVFASGKWWMVAPTSTYTYAQGTGITTGSFYAISVRVAGTPGKTVALASTDNLVGQVVEATTGVIPASGELVLVGKSSRATSGPNINFGVTNDATTELYITEAYIEKVSGIGAGVSGPYFDGAWGSSGDYARTWDGTAYASASTERALSVAETQPGAAAIIRSSEWALSGAYSLKVCSRYHSIDSGFAELTIPGVSAATSSGKTYTILASIRIAQVLAQAPGIQVTEIVNSVVKNTKVLAPKTVGVHQVRLTVELQAGLNSLFIRLYNNNAQGSPDVWFDDITVVEGTYTGDGFNGNSPNSGDYYNAWAVAPHLSQSIRYAFAVEGYTSPYADGMGYQSQEWASKGTKSLRVGRKPTAGKAGTNWAVQSPPFAIVQGKKYTVRTKIRIVKLHEGTSPVRRQLRLMTPTPILSPRAPETVGVHQIDWTFTADVTGSYPMQFWNGGIPSDADVWFDEFMFIDGDKIVPFFDGSTQPFLYDGQLVVPEWNGPANNSPSKFLHITQFPEQGEEGFTFIADDHLWVFKNNQWRNFGHIPGYPYLN